MKSYFLAAALFLSSIITGQNNNNPCDSPEASQFDFWVGEWECEWTSQDGSIKKGTNTVNKILDGCVIEENFNGYPGVALIGKSHSVYSPANGVWFQTWVDNSGGYLDFKGSWQEDKMILSRTIEKKDGSSFMQRMVWYNISEKEFDWNWERSDDNGDNWKTNWQLRYTRKNN